MRCGLVRPIRAVVRLTAARWLLAGLAQLALLLAGARLGRGETGWRQGRPAYRLEWPPGVLAAKPLEHGLAVGPLVVAGRRLRLARCASHQQFQFVGNAV